MPSCAYAQTIRPEQSNSAGPAAPHWYQSWILLRAYLRAMVSGLLPGTGIDDARPSSLPVSRYCEMACCIAWLLRVETVALIVPVLELICAWIWLAVVISSLAVADARSAAICSF